MQCFSVLGSAKSYGSVSFGLDDCPTVRWGYQNEWQKSYGSLRYCSAGQTSTVLLRCSSTLKLYLYRAIDLRHKGTPRSSGIPNDVPWSKPWHTRCFHTALLRLRGSLNGGWGGHNLCSLGVTKIMKRDKTRKRDNARITGKPVDCVVTTSTRDKNHATAPRKCFYSDKRSLVDTCSYGRAHGAQLPLRTMCGENR